MAATFQVIEKFSAAPAPTFQRGAGLGNLNPVQETLYQDIENVLRVRWAVEPPSGLLVMDMQVEDLNGGCAVWTGEVEARKCNGNLIVTIPHGCGDRKSVV